MKSLSIFACAVLAVTVFSCKQSDFSQAEERSEPTESVSADASGATTGNAVPSGRQFIRTADIRFKVKDVAKSTFEVEKAVNRFGGFVVQTNLQSNEFGTQTAKISQDSILETKRFSVTNDMVIRVPNNRLDSLLTAVQQQVGYLNHRIVKAEDVQLQMISNVMTQQRQAKHNARLEKGIDEKGKKIGDIAVAEDQLSQKSELADTAKIQNLDLKDKVAFSTVALQFYQNESVRREVLANPESFNYRTGFFTQLSDSLHVGWRIFEELIFFIVKFWTLWVIGLGVFVVIRKINRRKTINA